MSERKRFPNCRTLASITKGESLVINIEAVGNSKFYLVALMVISGVFVYALFVLIRGMFNITTIADLRQHALYGLPVVAFLFLWCFIGFQITLRRLSSIEISARDGVFHWKYHLFHWTKDIQARQEDVTAVITKAKWHKNELIVEMNGKTYSLDDLLADDMATIAKELRRALPIPTHH